MVVFPALLAAERTTRQARYAVRDFLVGDREERVQAMDPRQLEIPGRLGTHNLAGPLDYLGANPKIHCNVPQPSK